ncbi:MAG: hypothetical protein ACJAX5_002844, partial [Patiriisocius sp.]
NNMTFARSRTGRLSFVIGYLLKRDSFEGIPLCLGKRCDRSGQIKLNNWALE